jgi:hypothetical protein
VVRELSFAFFEFLEELCRRRERPLVFVNELATQEPGIEPHRDEQAAAIRSADFAPLHVIHGNSAKHGV